MIHDTCLLVVVCSIDNSVHCAASSSLSCGSVLFCVSTDNKAELLPVIMNTIIRKVRIHYIPLWNQYTYIHDEYTCFSLPFRVCIPVRYMCFFSSLTQSSFVVFSVISIKMCTANSSQYLPMESLCNINAVYICTSIYMYITLNLIKYILVYCVRVCTILHVCFKLFHVSFKLSIIIVYLCLALAAMSKSMNPASPSL